MPDLDWAKIKVATLMIGASDWRAASCQAIECEVGDITGKLTMCLHDRYFDAFGGRDRCVFVGCAGIRTRRDRSLPSIAMEGEEHQSLESR